MNVYYDIDGVLADLDRYLISYMKYESHPVETWDDPRIHLGLRHVWEDDEFWLTIPPLVEELPLDPTGYVTARSGRQVYLTEMWLWKHGFPHAPVISAKVKSTVIPKGSIMVDDSPHNYLELTEANVNCFLMDKLYNRNIETDKRIFNLSDLKKFV